MYQLPLRFIKVGNNLAVCATRITAIISTSSYQARRVIALLKRAGTLINGCGNKAAGCAIFLDNGAVVSSPFTVNKIMNDIERSNSKLVNKRTPSLTRRLKVYDVADELPDEELLQIIALQSAYDDLLIQLDEEELTLTEEIDETI